MNGFNPTATQNFIRMTAANWASNVATLVSSNEPLVPNTLYMVWDDTALPAGGVASFGTAATCGVTLYQTSETGLAYWVASLSQSQLVTLILAQGEIGPISGNSLLGNPTGSPDSPSAITLGTNLSFSGSVLNATGGGGPLPFEVYRPFYPTQGVSPSSQAPAYIAVRTGAKFLSEINLTGCVGSWTFDSLQKIGNTFGKTVISMGADATGFIADSLEEIVGDQVDGRNSSIANCSFAALLKAKLRASTNFDFSGGSLNQASVDNLLIRLAYMDGVNAGTTEWAGTVNLSGGTSSAPSGASAAAIAALIGRGATVITN